MTPEQKTLIEMNLRAAEQSQKTMAFQFAKETCGPGATVEQVIAEATKIIDWFRNDEQKPKG